MSTDSTDLPQATVARISGQKDLFAVRLNDKGVRLELTARQVAQLMTQVSWRTPSAYAAGEEAMLVDELKSIASMSAKLLHP